MTANQIGQLLACAFFGVCFAQSSLDKVIDWKGNAEFLQGHFAKTPLRGVVNPMLATVTAIEFAAAALCLIGGVLLAAGQGPLIALWGLGTSGAAFLMLFFGQRVAKDYLGAGTLACYFGVLLASLLLFR